MLPAPPHNFPAMTRSPVPDTPTSGTNQRQIRRAHHGAHSQDHCAGYERFSKNRLSFGISLLNGLNCPDGMRMILMGGLLSQTA